MGKEKLIKYYFVKKPWKKKEHIERKNLSATLFKTAVFRQQIYHTNNVGMTCSQKPTTLVVGVLRAYHFVFIVKTPSQFLGGVFLRLVHLSMKTSDALSGFIFKASLNSATA